MSATVMPKDAPLATKSAQCATGVATRPSLDRDSSRISRLPALSTLSTTGDVCVRKKADSFATPDSERTSSLSLKGSGE